MKNPLSGFTDRIPLPGREHLEKAATITVGAAAAIWMLLRLRRELYGPGGTKMSRYDRRVDEVWEKHRARKSSAS